MSTMSPFSCKVADIIQLRSEQWSIYVAHIDKAGPPWMENTASAVFELLDIVNETGRIRRDLVDMVWQKPVILDKKLLRKINKP